MLNHLIFERNPDLKEFMHLLRHEIQQAQRPADEVVLSDEDVMKMLKISRRTLQYLKADGIITVRKLHPESTRSYYFLSDILKLLKDNTIENITSKLKIK